MISIRNDEEKRRIVTKRGYLMQIKYLVCNEFGNPKDVLQLAQKPMVTLASQELYVRMLACPINPSDLIPLRGSYAHRVRLPITPGYEGVGIVEAVGDGVSSQLIGQHVLPLRGEGTWQEMVKVHVDYTVPVPNDMAIITASQLYINPLTAWVVCTEVLSLKPHHTVAINACGSSLGRIFAQLAHIIGFTLIAIVRNERHTNELLAFGATHVINATTENIHETIMALTHHQGVEAAIDSIGGETGTNLAFSVKAKGDFITLGLLSGQQVNWARIANDTTVNTTVFHLRHWNRQTSVAKWQATFQIVIALVESGKIKLYTEGKQYSFSQIAQAIDAVNSGEQGKVFLIGNV